MWLHGIAYLGNAIMNIYLYFAGSEFKVSLTSLFNDIIVFTLTTPILWYH